MDRLQRLRVPILIALMGTIGLVAFAVLRPAPSAPALVLTLRPTSVPTAAPTEPTTIQVYVSGAVKVPDVYDLPVGSIVKDALTAAGGPADDADLDRINLAAPLSDAMQVHFPRTGESSAVPGDPVSASAASAPVNINTATVEQLDLLPGIGPAIAQRIVEFRETNGLFTSLEQIKDVKGIGDALFEKIKDRITIGP